MRRDDDASELDAFAVLPKLFERVSPPTVFRENVHDDVERVDDAPAAVRLVLHAHVRRGNDVAHRLFQLDAQRAQMRIGRSRRNHEIIRHRRFFPEKNHLDVGRLLLFERGDATPDEPDARRGIFRRRVFFPPRGSFFLRRARGLFRSGGLFRGRFRRRSRGSGFFRRALRLRRRGRFRLRGLGGNGLFRRRPPHGLCGLGLFRCFLHCCHNGKDDFRE